MKWLWTRAWLIAGTGLVFSCRNSTSERSGATATSVDSRSSSSSASAGELGPPVTKQAGSPVPSFSASKVTGSGSAMGTHLAYAAFTTPTVGESRTHALFDEATAEIVRLEKLMTTWDPNSEVSRINAAAGRHPVAVSQETFDVIAESLHDSEMSQGAFDITFETLHGLWKFDQDLDPHPPTPQQVRERVKYMGYRHVRVDASAHTVYLDEAHVRIGLGGIAKGYAVDRAAHVLAQAGFTDSMVDGGGDVLLSGTKNGAPWHLGIQDPRKEHGQIVGVAAVSNRALVTSGDYERFRIVNGVRYHHIIDPRTGWPASASISVSVMSKSAEQGVVLAKGIFMLGPEKGLALARSQGVEAMVIDPQEKQYFTEGFRKAYEANP